MASKALFAPLALMSVLACGSTDFLPSAPGEFDVKTDAKGVVVLERDAPELKEYKRIGTALAKAKKEIDAVNRCREIAAENGGEGILMPESKGDKEWKCAVLRHKGKYTE